MQQGDQHSCPQTRANATERHVAESPLSSSDLAGLQQLIRVWRALSTCHQAQQPLAADAESTVPHVRLLQVATDSECLGTKLSTSTSHEAGHAPTEPAFLHKKHQNTFDGRDGGALPPTTLSTATAAGARPAAAPSLGAARNAAPTEALP